MFNLPIFSNKHDFCFFLFFFPFHFETDGENNELPEVVSRVLPEFPKIKLVRKVQPQWNYDPVKYSGSIEARIVFFVSHNVFFFFSIVT